MTQNSQAADLSAELRSDSGTGAARALRRMGKVPAVVYGQNQASNLHIALDLAQLRAVARSKSLTSGILELAVNDQTLQVLVREIQRHPVLDSVVHIDFQSLDKTNQVTISVPVEYIGSETCVGIKRGGVLNIVRHDVELRCLASAIPEKLTVDLSAFDIGESVHIDVVDLPAGVQPTIDRNFTLATIAAPGGGVKEADEADEESSEE